MPKRKRILLKISGESLLGDRTYGIDPEHTRKIAKQIKEVAQKGIEVVIVVGGGNIFRGVSVAAKGMDRSTADYMGMLATVMNAMALQDAIESLGQAVRVCSAINMPEIAEPYLRRRAIRHLEKGRVVIATAGTGNPFFTTDTAAALRALELNCDVLLKGTKVDGVYDKDPTKHKNAKLYKKVSFTEALSKNLKVMDATAFSLCRDSNLKVLVFNMFKKGNILKAATTQNIGTIIS
ncbi:MAG: UMP kinase [Candidatus Gracilibacteria bacterium]|nr:UMP kinase [Candidatus Gracilibacteria bacterium]